MNIHPIFVHFPIALLTLYSLFECIRFRSVMNKGYWFFVKSVFVIVGTISGFLALFTGGLAEDLHRGNPALRILIHTHSNWAAGTIIIYSIISVAYIVRWVEQTEWFRNHKTKDYFSRAWPPISYGAGLVSTPWVIIVLAVLGLVTVTITGALGGAIVYGPTIDPVVGVIYHLFFK